LRFAIEKFLNRKSRIDIANRKNQFFFFILLLTGSEKKSITKPNINVPMPDNRLTFTPSEVAYIA